MGAWASPSESPSTFVFIQHDTKWPDPSALPLNLSLSSEERGEQTLYVAVESCFKILKNKYFGNRNQSQSVLPCWPLTELPFRP